MGNDVEAYQGRLKGGVVTANEITNAIQFWIKTEGQWSLTGAHNAFKMLCPKLVEIESKDLVLIAHTAKCLGIERFKESCVLVSVNMFLPPGRQISYNEMLKVHSA